jgi:hypothetical protein
MQGEDAAVRCHSLRRQRLEISWRLVFGLDVQHLVSGCTRLARLLQRTPSSASWTS